MDINLMIWGIFISIVGFAYYRYGKKTKRAFVLYTGIILMLLPYFIYNLTVLALLSILLGLFPFIIDK